MGLDAKTIDRWYSRRHLSMLGKLVLLALIPIGLLSTLDFEKMLLKLTLKEVFPQRFSVSANEIKYNTKTFHRFIRGIKQQQGTLILGTSESNSLEGENYQYLLNQDSTVKERFSHLAGAGRNLYVYFPVILANPELFNRLDVLVFVNPIYWKRHLNKLSTRYATRYTDSGLWLATQDEATAAGIYDPIYATYFDQTPWNDQVVGRGAYALQQWRSTYFVGLKNVFVEQPPFQGSRFAKDRDLEAVFNVAHTEKLLESMDLEQNLSKAFGARDHGGQPALRNDISFSYDNLSSFITLSKQVGINATYVLGPYNGISAEAEGAEVLQSYEMVTDSLRSLFDANGLPYIDCTAISFIPGSFSDYQHHSKYGAYLIEQQIAAYYQAHEDR